MSSLGQPHLTLDTLCVEAQYTKTLPVSTSTSNRQFSLMLYEMNPERTAEKNNSSRTSCKMENESE